MLLKFTAKNSFYLRIAAFILCFFIILVRSLPRLYSAHLWAEDGAVFLQDYLNEGFISSIIKPYTGYYHVIPRILIAVVTNISIDYIPHLIILASSFFYALVASLVVSESYNYLLPNVSYRFIIAIALCLLPGTWEVIGDLADLHCILILFLLMWGMRNLEPKNTWYQAAFGFLICASAGEVVVCLPLFLTRIFIELRRRLISLPDIAIILSIMFWVVVNTFTTLSSNKTLAFPFSQFRDFTFTFLAQRLTVLPILGPNLAYKLIVNEYIFFKVFALVIGCYLLFVLFKTFKQEYILFLLSILGSSIAIAAIAWVVRPYVKYVNLGWFKTDSRFGFIGSFYGPFLISMGLFYAFKYRKWRNWVFLLYLSLVISTNSSHFWLGAWGEQQNWSKAARTINSVMETGCPQTARIPINPRHWSFVVTSPKHVRCSEKLP